MPVMFWIVCLTFSCTFSHRGMTLLPYTTVRCTVTVAMPSSMTTVTGFCRPVRPRSERTFWLVLVEDAVLDEEARARANQQEVAVYAASLPAYETALQIAAALAE